ncbi:LapA family protein [Bacillus fonticola]|uniref:LapA family protein n=1 Tax=Bacillus fonticola TaxID=2728853 RepID=UPI0014766525|nr:lipopolysaccharide assembly protein LapA domain-containing protein [Bacillus fonticola]
MKQQWWLLLSFLFALIVAIFAVVNVDSVRVNYVFGEAEWPLVLVILTSVLMGGLIVGSVSLFRLFFVGRQLKATRRDNESLQKELDTLRETLTEKSSHTLKKENIPPQTDPNDLPTDESKNDSK